MKSKRMLGAIITIILVIIGIYFLFKNIEIKKVEDEYQDYIPQEEISNDQLRQTKVLLYFENIDTGKLESEIKIIDANQLIKCPEKKLVELLIKGPESTKLKKLIPDKVVLNDIKVENGCAIINFSKEILDYESEENKLKIINSIVNTLTNLKEINSISFLINGEKNDKLSDIYLKNNQS